MANDSTRAPLELLNNISRELAAGLELRMVLQRILLLSLGYVNGERGSIIVLDDNGQALDSAIVYRTHMHAHATGQLHETVDRGLAGWVMRNRKPAVVEDTSQDERWLRRPDDAADHSGPKSAICVPLLARDRLVGVLTVVHPTPGYFNTEHLALIQAVADQAGAAVLNARLYDESQRQARVMTALAESAVAMNASLELVEVLQRILDQTAQALRVETVLLGLIDESGKQLEFRAATGNRPDHPVVGIHLPLGEGIAGRVAQSGQGIVVPNTQGSQVVQIPGIDIRALVCAPVQIQGKIIGVLEAINPLSGTFDADALFVLSGIGSLAGIAIHNAQLYGQVDQAHLRYHELFDDSIDPIIITDCLGKILEANRQATNTLGYSQAVLQQLNIGAIHQQMPSKTGKELEFIGEGDPISYESRLYTSGGTTVPIQVYARKVHMEGADCIQWILRDISERKDLDSLREDLIAMVYHDLRSPLANVVSSLDVMESMLPPQDGGSLSSVLNIAIRSTGRIQRLVNSLLDITRLESGQTLINQAPVDTHTLVADTLDAVQSLSKSKGQSIDINLPENLPNLWADEDMIRRVMVNLVENAVKFSPAKSHIEVGAQVAGNQVKFWVQDSGSGIPLELQDTIFEKFTRLHADSGTKGLGLGLAFCRLAIQAHGGKIWLESKPKAGSRFFFTLPAAPSEFPTPAQAA